MGNDAVYVNGFSNNSGTVDNHITIRGSDFLFAVCAIMGEFRIFLTLILPKLTM
jgi:bacteriorhodopsin